MYKTSSVVLGLFAVAHTLGFAQGDPSWHADAAVHAMKSVTFPVQGVVRSYWDFFMAFGLFFSVFLVYSAMLAWRMGAMSRDELRARAIDRWLLAGAFVIVSGLSWWFAFAIPAIFATASAATLVAAAAFGGAAPTSGKGRSPLDRGLAS
jgi:hypothetical protein